MIVTVAQLYQRHYLESLANEKMDCTLFVRAGFMPEVARTLGEMAKSQLCISLSSSIES